MREFIEHKDNDNKQKDDNETNKQDSEDVTKKSSIEAKNSVNGEEAIVALDAGEGEDKADVKTHKNSTDENVSVSAPASK